VSNRYKPYAEYKPSGVEWLGLVPRQWLVGPIKRTAHLQAGFAFQSADFSTSTGVPIVRMNNIANGVLTLTSSVKVPADIVRNEFYLNDNDILMGMSGSIENIARVSQCDLPCALNQRVGRFLAHAVTADFLWYVIQSRGFKEQVFLSATGTAQLNISSEQIEACISTWPECIEHQRAIAVFLDRETGKIDRMIGKQERMIELLKEKRQAVISHAVTKGLDPNAPMKDSGIEWLGEIPAHWGLSKMRYAFSFGKGLTITKRNLQDSGIPCVNYGEVHSKYGFEVSPKKHSLKCVGEQYLQSSRGALLNQGDFVFADTSEDIEGSGNFTQLISKDHIFAGYHTIIARPYERENSRFHAYLFDSYAYRSQIQNMVKGVKVYSVTQAILRASRIWLPSKEEQKNIAAYLDQKIEMIDNLIAKAEQAIGLMKERRTALISAAVTGKIDVRNEA
jgi:type I restriction enzyme S subunit